MKKILIVCLTFAVLFVTTPKQAQASNYFSKFKWWHSEEEHKPHHTKRPPHPEETIVTGIVFDGDKDRVNGDKPWEIVTVTCNGTTKTADIDGDGVFTVSFKRKDCEGQSPLTVSAVTEVGSGSTTTNIENDPDEGTWADVYLTLYDINVPEFGTIMGAVVAATSAAAYLSLKKKIV